MISLPISLTVQSLAMAMLAKSGLRSVFHLMVVIAMGKMETAIQAPTDYVLVLDRSGSTGDPLGESGDTILDVAKSSAEQVINTLNPGDRIAVVQFNGHCNEGDVLLGLTQADEKGKTQATNAVYSIRCSGTTAFAPAIDRAASLFGEDATRKRAIIFLTDGANGGGSDPVVSAQQVQAAGISLFCGGLGVNNTGEQLLDSMAGTNFKSLNTAQDVVQFFADAQVQAAMAAVTNARLTIAPVTFAEVMNFELVTKGGQPNYAPADPSGKVVQVGEISEGNDLQSYLALQVVLPEDIKSGRRAFGKLELHGDVAGLGLQNHLLASAPIAVQFTEQPVQGLNAEVKSMINIAATSRELYLAGQAGDAATMKQHVDNARKTVAFSNDAVAQALADSIKDIDQKIASDPEQAQKQARRATKGFSAADAAAALNASRK